MRLFQYWDTGDPPDDVAECVESFRATNPDMDHRLFSRDDAAWFIKKQFGQRELKAFEALAVPAMQADYFRLCAMVAKAGVWFDVDCRARRPLRTLLEQVPYLLLVVLDGGLINSTVIARDRGNPFLKACLAVSTSIIEDGRLAGQIKMIAIPATAGPALFHAIWEAAAPEAPTKGPLARTSPPELVRALVRELLPPSAVPVQAVADATFLHLVSVQKWGAPAELGYKQTDRHWLKWNHPIYVEVQPTPHSTATS